jgi:MFS family permease
LYVSHFTDNEVVIGLVPAIFSGGWLLPQLFTANWVQRLPRKKIAPVRVGLFSERLPILLLALSAWWLPTDYPQLALVAFFLIFTWNQFGGGLIAVAWQDMVAKIFPTDRRGRFLGFSHFSGTAMGVLCAAAATWFLEQYGFPKGYALSFSVGAVCIFISWSFLALTREPAQVSEAPQVSQREYLRSLPAVVRSDTNFARYLLNQAVWALSGMGTGFVAVYAVQRWSLPDSIAGSFTAALLVGQAAGNLFFGPLADRKGFRTDSQLDFRGVRLYRLQYCGIDHFQHSDCIRVHHTRNPPDLYWTGKHHLRHNCGRCPTVRRVDGRGCGVPGGFRSHFCRRCGGIHHHTLVGEGASGSCWKTLRVLNIPRVCFVSTSNLCGFVGFLTIGWFVC